MLNVWAYFCGATNHPAHPRDPYILKQMSFSHPTNPCAITFK